MILLVLLIVALIINAAFSSFFLPHTVLPDNVVILISAGVFEIVSNTQVI